MWEISYDKPSACKKRWKIFVKRIIVKVTIPSSINEETVCRVLEKASVKWTYVQRKGTWPKMTQICDLSLLEKFVVSVQCATMKYEIIRKPMVLERVEVNFLKFSH